MQNSGTQGQALPPSARQVARAHPLKTLQPRHLQRQLHAFSQQRVVQTVHLAVKLEIVADRQVVVQAETLGHIPYSRAYFSWMLDHRHTQDFYRSIRGLEQTEHHTDRGRLS